MLMLAVALLVLAFGGAAFAVAFGSNETSQKRIAGIARAQPGGHAARTAPESQGQRRKSMQQLLKEIEKKQAEKKPTMTLRRRLDRAGFAEVPTRNFWIASGLVVFLTVALCLFGAHMSLLVSAGAAFTAGFGLPRWVLNFLRNRREKRFTNDFAAAIDVIVRSVKSGLPTSDALKIVAAEFRDPVGSEFTRLIDSMKVGVTLEQALKRMYENMPTTEVSFFAIVMTIQQKSGGNLSEALGNLAAVLRDRKRLQGKIKAMSSEAKASAMIIGSLPPGVMALVYFTTPAYMSLLFTERAGNLMLAGCVVWMSLGIFVMKKMINFKH
jgi:tight adherence protein B